ncbi:MAG: hypothetical protein O7D96_04045, partial [SAR324 cluster bacterium]|nr:hypothetical protein [SAR324 cluster bacterium]
MANRIRNRIVHRIGHALCLAATLFLILGIPSEPVRGQEALIEGAADFLKERFESEMERLFLEGLAHAVCKDRDKGG